jgi:23S rRNA G2069 N7-methylase RlmK/C1962 C5-methylase RlmI
VYLKQRFLADARQSGGLLAPDATELPVPVKAKRKAKKERRKERDQPTNSDASSAAGGSTADGSTAEGGEGDMDGPIVLSEGGLKYELNITRGEHIGLFFDSRTGRLRTQAV